MTPCKTGNPENCGIGVEHYRYEVWCVSNGERRFIGWVSDVNNIEFVDTEADTPKEVPDKVWGETKPIGGGE